MLLFWTLPSNIIKECLKNFDDRQQKKKEEEEEKEKKKVSLNKI
jgi:hypothetical protein